MMAGYLWRTKSSGMRNKMSLTEELLSQAEHLEDPNNSMLVLAEKSGSEVLLGIVSDALVHAAAILREAATHTKEADSIVSSDNLDDLASLASWLDSSDDLELRKKAGVLDQLLINFASPSSNAIKLADEQEIAKIREKYKLKDLYTKSKIEHDKDSRAEETSKLVKEQIKECRPLEAPLQTRTCPDHPGAQMMRVGDGSYQCDLDKKVYDWHNGFTTMKGNKVPGGNVSEQTRALVDQPIAREIFDSRESRLNG